ncbi:MAG: RHS repeat-associated core domain-containing protein [Candidatus Auribacterota bacterium]|nr:RHS repeat-associated core domain-containing protein [Candidatus Auribacterota bacterium]
MTGYLYDAGRLIAEYNASGKVFAQYIHGSGLGGDVGSLLFAQKLIGSGEETSVETSYYFHNWRGDVVAVTGESGNPLDTYRYSAFGEVIEQSGASDNDILFSSKRYHGATALSYFGARYYDASLGRFISRDPLGYIDGPNGYIDVSHNPLIWFDPFGLCRESAKKTSFSFAEAMATDQIRFSQTGYIASNPPNVVQIGGGYNVGATTGTSQETGFIIAITPEEGFVFKKYYSATGGVHVGITASGTDDVTFWNNVNTVKDLEGGGFEMGGSYTLGFSFGGALTTTDSNAHTYGIKGSLGSGYSGTLGEVHVYKTGTIIFGGIILPKNRTSE